MFEQMRHAAALLAAGMAFSTAAWGQPTLEQRVDGAKTIAAEFFGAAAGRLVRERSDANDPTKVVLKLANGPIAGGNEAKLTFSLTGAAFADRVSLSQFEVGAGASLSLVAEGGQARDSSVAVLLEVGGAGLADGDVLTFRLPDLQVAPAAIDDSGTKGAAVDVSIEGVRRTSNAFPDVIGDMANPGGDAGAAGVYRLQSAVAVSLDAVVGSEDNTGFVDLMDRKVLTNADEGSSTGSLAIAFLGVDINGAGVKALAEDGTGAGMDPDVGRSDFPGSLVLTANGNFQTGDKVVVVIQFSTHQVGEEFARNEDGSYTGEYAISDLDAEAIGGSLRIRYFPGGVDDLLPATFTTTAEVRYDDPKNVSGSVEGQGTGRIEYQGLSLAGYANGIVMAGDEAGTTYLRVACANATDCTVFASCRDESGGSYFGELGMVPAGGTEVYNGGEIGEALDGGWDMGGGRCDLLSDGFLEVQNMYEQGSININNSLVTNGAGILTKGMAEGN